jgi:hypothetical protein
LALGVSSTFSISVSSSQAQKEVIFFGFVGTPFDVLKIISWIKAIAKTQQSSVNIGFINPTYKMVNPA